MRAILVGLLAMMTMAGAWAQELTIVREGQPASVIVLQPDASEQLAEAVGEMQALIERSTGARLQIAPAPPEGMAAIHIGRTPAAEALGLDLGDLDADGFVIEFPDGRTIVILGPTDWGTEFGVYEFLERYVGVRWLMPGPDGTHVPAHGSLAIPAQPVRDEPAFFSRKYFGLGNDAQWLWARRNRLHDRIEFHHQLYRLFPHSDVEEHPEFFPIRNGERYLPPQAAHYHGWQPCFTAPGIVDVAVERIVRYFDEHPQAESYSLGINDSNVHCQCPQCQALDVGRKNFLGLDHLSDRYLTWANAVVEGVLERHPDKWFGFLAYSEIFEPPDRVAPHPRLIPYITYDRMKWIDAQIRAAGEEVTRRWADAVPVVGWYDYIYGASYLVPRVYPHLMADYYRAGYRDGVRALTAEAYPNFGEGPKLYVSLKLQWDPQADVDALLDEWYTLAVGPEAAPYLRRYYQHWEDFWTRRILDSEWWTEQGQYLRFNVPTYLEDVSLDEIAQCRDWLEAAVAKAQTQEQRARAELLLRAFEYYEASAIAYPRRGPAPQMVTEAQALAWLEDIARRAELAAARRRMSAVEFQGHPFLQHCFQIDRYPLIAGQDWAAGDLWTLFDWVERSEAVRARIESLAREGEPEGMRIHAQTMLLALAPDDAGINPNPSFEEGEGTPAAGWSMWLQDGVGTLTLSEEAAHGGRWGLLGEGIQYGGPMQVLDFAPGRYCLVARMLVPAGQPEGGFVDVTLYPLGEGNRNLPKSGTASITPTPGVWHTVATVIDVREPPEGAVRLRLGIWARDFPPGKRIHFDDIVLVRLPDEPEAG
ncbi:MAG: DUF4838 domain-containing protein [Armatimonadota bacterium]